MNVFDAHIMNSKKIIEKLIILKNHFDEWKIPQLHEHEVNQWLQSWSRENYLYFIMTCSLNYQRVSPNTWKSALATSEDRETQEVFFPEMVAKLSEDKLREKLMKHKLALQKVKHIQIWKTIMQTWQDHFWNDPRKLFQQWNYEVESILQIVQKDLKKWFPYLSWPKLSNYFLFILRAYSDIKLQNTYKISIIPDTHVMQATEVLAILPAEEISPINVESAWKKLLKETDFSPIDFHSILWNWSRNNFEPKL